MTNKFLDDFLQKFQSLSSLLGVFCGFKVVLGLEVVEERLVQGQILLGGRRKGDWRRQPPLTLSFGGHDGRLIEVLISGDRGGVVVQLVAGTEVEMENNTRLCWLAWHIYDCLVAVRKERGISTIDLSQLRLVYRDSQGRSFPKLSFDD